MKIFRLLSIFYIIVISLSIISIPETVGAIERSCNAHYAIKIHSINGRSENLPISKITNFYARRGCKQSAPNTCRRRARDAAHHCMKIHWINRARTSKPGECTSSFGVHNYSFVDIRQDIEESICRHHRVNQYDKVVFSLYSITEGDTGCGLKFDIMKTALIQGNYTLECTIDRKW